MSQPEEEPKPDMMSKPQDIKVPAPLSSAEPVSPPTADKKPLPAVTETSPALETGPTDSHTLATIEHDEKGAAQIGHSETEVKDLGWDKVAEHVPAPVVGGLPNEELWILVRRFNHVYPSLLLNNQLMMAAIVSCQGDDGYCPWGFRFEYCR